MRTLPVVVADELGQDGSKVRLANDHQVIQTLAAQGADRRWLRREVRQVWSGGRAGPRRRYRWTEVLLTAMPSFRSSPRMRSAPHAGLSRAIVAIRARTSGLTRGRPTRARDRQRQTSR